MQICTFQISLAKVSASQVGPLQHNAGKIEQLEAVAKDYGLLVSGGTDYHGFTGRDMPMGSIEIPYEILEAIKKRLKEKRS